MSATVKRGRALINAQALIGTMLADSVLQQLLGQGGMGAVFLAQQQKPLRSVAVKVVSPTTVQTPHQRTQFLERFHQEINALRSLEHANIVPIYAHGEQNGLAFLVMPYITGGTLQQVLEQQESLQFSVIATYLDQLAAALDYAHEQGVIHRNLRPANVLIDAQGRLLLTDFGMVKIAIERHSSQMRLLKSDTPIGSLEYMAPEQVMGDVIDAHTDLYTLGVILYQMVTGKTPFQGGTPIQIATQLVQAAPPSPQQLRADLPVAAEQVILQALAKRSQDRFTRCADFANAFRAALTASGLLPNSLAISSPADKNIGNNTAVPSLAHPRRRSLFDPVWQHSPEEASPSQSKTTEGNKPLVKGATPPAQPTFTPRTPGILVPEPAAPTRLRQGLRNSLLRSVSENTTAPLTQTATIASSMRTPPSPPVPTMPVPPITTTTPPISEQTAPHLFGNMTRILPQLDREEDTIGTTGALTVPDPLSPFPATNTTGALMVPGSEQGTVKLTGAMKVVQVPIAGQPGRYVTGLLPVLPSAQQTQQTPPTETPLPETRKPKLTRLQKSISLALVVALLFFIPGILLFAHSRPNQVDKSGIHREDYTPDLSAIYAAQATATANANNILSDPLTQNIHNWPIADSGYKVYMFKNGAYHILDNTPNQSAPAILPGVVLTSPMVYTLSMQEVKGNDSSVNNSFGMIFRFSSQPQGNQNIVTFYSFEVVNTHSGEYQFWKYDNSKGRAAHPWTSIWHHTFGGEFHQGQGPKNTNTFKISANGKSFTFLINGKKVGTAQDASLTGGEIGMLVNLQGTEVAFMNLSLTYN